MSASTRPSLVIKRHIKAPPAKVFAAWTDPKMMVQWWGPQGASDVEAETDLRAGGRFHTGFETPDGERHDVSGIYREIVPDERLVFTWAWRTTPERESLVTVTVAPDGAGTMLTLLHEQFFDDEARDGHKRGWTGAVDKLEALFA